MSKKENFKMKGHFLLKNLQQLNLQIFEFEPKFFHIISVNIFSS